MGIIKHGLFFKDISNYTRGGRPSAMLAGQYIPSPVNNIEKPDMRKLERTLRKIEGVSRRQAKELCNKASKIDWQKNLVEREAENKEMMKDYMQPLRDTETKLNTYTKALCDAELKLLDEYEEITKSLLKSDYVAFNTQKLLGKYSYEH